MNEYEQFLENKKHTSIDFGIKPIFIPENMFDYQKFICEKMINKGRHAGFIDTGLGKTLIEIVTATNYVRSLNKRCLIITPLAVAFQFIKEAEKFGIDDIEYSKDGKFTKKIVVCNYERLDKFNHSDFECVILDESSILKNFNGAIKEQITIFVRKVKYRYLFTATPSPNDYIELGTSSEALGYLGYTDMLTRFFANNENNIRPQDIGNKFYLKPHAKDNFFNWVRSWSVSMRKPSDLGFDDTKFILPKLNINQHQVKNDKNWVENGQILMFGKIAKRLSEVREEQKMTIENRCNKAVELANTHDTSVYWCNFNDEGDLLNTLDKNAYQIKGSMDIDKKEELLLAFAKGEIKKLITKPSITCFGLNWQHCNHTVYFPTFSYEQYYQAIRRFWRFGQKREVTCDMVFSDGQKRVIDTLFVKSDKAQELFSELSLNVNSDYKIKTREFNKEVILPKFLNK